MKNLKSTNHIALYVYSGYESLIFAARILGAAGFKTVIATYGSNILQDINDFSELNVIVLDRVRDIEQLKYCSQLRDDDRTKNIPIIAIVANDEITEDFVINFGVDKCLRMPLDIDLFREIVSDYLDR
jgi:DNA-binding response OmpR family regulator